VRRYAFVDHAAALREFRRLFANSPELRRSVTADVLPVSFRLELRRSSDRPGVGRTLRRLRGVDTVTEGPVGLRRFVAACKARRYNVEVFMRVYASPEQVATVRAAIERHPNITVVRFLDHNDALREFRREFASDKKQRGVTAADLPESFLLQVPANDVEVVQHELQQVDGVADVAVPDPLCLAVDLTTSPTS